jgi:hypothetical protein
VVVSVGLVSDSSRRIDKVLDIFTGGNTYEG